jgi:hypothetical protein
MVIKNLLVLGMLLLLNRPWRPWRKMLRLTRSNHTGTDHSETIGSHFGDLVL